MKKIYAMASQNPEEIKLKNGASATVTLRGLATSGYQWNYAIDENKDCVSISKDFIFPEKSSQQKPGASADEVFTIKAKKVGVVNINFFQQRSWEKNIDPANTKKVKVIIE